MSQKALPGDTLYGLKRASESWELTTAGSSTDKARDYLKFAQTRVNEAQALAKRAGGSAAGAGPQAGGLDSHTTGLITSTLASADHDVRSASSLLGGQAVKSKSTSPLSVLPSWAPDQLAKLRELASAMPDAALRSRTASSAQLVTAAVARANQLAATVHTGCLSTANADQLGPLPVSSCSAGSVLPPKKHEHAKASQSGAKTHKAGTNGGSSPSPKSGGSGSPNPTGSTSPSPSPTSSSNISVPSLPTTSLPVSVNSCTIQLLGVVKITVCPSG